MARKLALTAALFGLFLAIGTIGYVVIEGWPPFEAFYMTIITLSTVGFGEIKNLSETGRIFTSFLIFGGIGTACYGFTLLTEAIVSGQLGEVLGEKRNKRALEKLKDHYIVCGFGNIGRKLINLLQLEGKPFVVIEKDREVVEEIKHRELVYIWGNAVEKEVLKLAKIDRAKGVFACGSNDSENIYIALVAKSLNPDIRVVARNEQDTEKDIYDISKVDAVVAPGRVGARRMFLSMLRPHILDALDEFTIDRAADTEEILVEDIRITSNSTLKQLSLKPIETVYVLLIKRKNGEIETSFDENTPLQEGDIIIVIGHEQKIKGLEQTQKK